jgi:outer membrane protein TolC
MSSFFWPLDLTVLREMTRLTTLRIVLAAALSASLAHAAGAQSLPRAAPMAGPLDTVVAEALRNNLGLAGDRQAVARAEANLREARGRFFPSLSMDARYSELSGALNLGDLVNPAYAALNQVIGSDRFPTNLDVTLPFPYESRLRLSQPIFNATILAGHSLARHTRDGQRLEYAASARSLAARAQSAFLEVGAARSARRIWESTLALVTESERVAQRLVDAGRATPDQVLRARADRSDAQQNLDAARQTESAAARAFNDILHRPLDTPVEELPDSLLRFEIPVPEEQAVAHALTRREELGQAGAGIRAAQAGVRLATSSLIPSLSVAVDYGFQGQTVRLSGDNDFAAASLVLGWTISLGGSDFARRQAAKADVERLRIRHTEVEDQVRLDVRQSYEAAVVARDAIATADDRLAAARRSFELVRRRYEEGLASQVELIDARTAYTNADLNRVITVYRYAIRYIDLERAAALRELGSIGRES